MTWGILIAVVFLVLFIFTLLTLGEGLLKVTASQAGEDAGEYSVLPNSIRSIIGRSKGRPRYIPDGVPMKSLNRGFDIKLLGEATIGEEGIPHISSSTYALKPKDILGMSPIPKVVPEVGTQVKAGEPLFYDKKHPDVIYAAPVSGEFIELRRGEKRSIAALVLLADQQVEYYKHENIPNVGEATREELVSFLLQSGAWPFIRQRPFDVIADPEETPKSIFVSTFDTAPLAPNLNLAVEGKEAHFHKGLEVLARLTGSKVHLGLSANGKEAPHKAFTDVEIEGVEKHWFKGAHPAGNVGIHMHHIDPVLPGSTVWYSDVQGIILIGKLFNEGIYDSERLVAVTGQHLPEARYVWAHQGINIEALTEGMPADMAEEERWVRNDEGKKEIQTVPVRKIRIVSGDLLTGQQVERNSYLSFYDDQLSTADEGDHYEMLGWLVPQTGHPTISRTFPGGFFNDIKYTPDTNTNGEKRAFVVTGQYESVLPMNIYPQHVLRAVLAKDFEKMEGLGILELSEEDVALCEYVCTSKQPVQQILREGLDMLREQ